MLALLPGVLSRLQGPSGFRNDLAANHCQSCPLGLFPQHIRHAAKASPQVRGPIQPLQRNLGMYLYSPPFNLYIILCPQPFDPNLADIAEGSQEVRVNCEFCSIFYNSRCPFFVFVFYISMLFLCSFFSSNLLTINSSV